MTYNNDIELIVTSIKEISSKRRLIHINYEPAFALYSSEVRKYSIKENQTLDFTLYREIIDDILTKRAKLRVLNLLKSRDYTEHEINQKLKESYYPEDLIEVAINYAKSYGYIDDERYVDNYLQFKAGEKSQRLIKQALMKKGVSKSLIDQAFEYYNSAHEDSELNMIITMMKKKKNKYDFPRLTFDQKSSILAYFYRKGFQIDLIKKALDIVVEDCYNS